MHDCSDGLEGVKAILAVQMCGTLFGMLKWYSAIQLPKKIARTVRGVSSIDSQSRSAQNYLDRAEVC